VERNCCFSLFEDFDGLLRSLILFTYVMVELMEELVVEGDMELGSRVNPE
jgi:hypothetical protein